MIALRNALFFVLVNAPLAWVSVGRAEDPPKPAKQMPPSISLQFAGGTLADYVKALQGTGGHVNVVVGSPEATGIKLPPIKLESVRADAAVALLRGEYKLSDGSEVDLMVNDFGSFDDGAAPVFKIWTKPTRGRPPTAAESAKVRVWNIGGLLGKDHQAAVVLTAVETAVSLLDASHEKAQIRYHDDSTLLIASGDADQLQAIDRVVDGFREGAKHRAEVAAAAEGADAIGGLFEWVADMRRFDAEQEEKGRSHELTQAKVGELNRLLDAVRGELRQKDERIAELERRLAEKGKP